MLIVSSVVNRKMCFPHVGKIFTINQLTYYDPKSQTSPLSNVSSVTDKHTISSLTNVSPGVCKGSTLLVAYYGPPSTPSEPRSSSF